MLVLATGAVFVLAKAAGAAIMAVEGCGGGSVLGLRRIWAGTCVVQPVWRCAGWRRYRGAELRARARSGPGRSLRRGRPPRPPRRPSQRPTATGRRRRPGPTPTGSPSRRRRRRGTRMARGRHVGGRRMGMAGGDGARDGHRRAWGDSCAHLRGDLSDAARSVLSERRTGPARAPRARAVAPLTRSGAGAVRERRASGARERAHCERRASRAHVWGGRPRRIPSRLPGGRVSILRLVSVAMELRFAGPSRSAGSASWLRLGAP